MKRGTKSFKKELKEDLEEIEEEIESKKHKSTSRVKINSSMMGILFGIFSIIWALSTEKINSWLLIQLVIAIPLLFVSSLSYAKVGLHGKTKLFDKFGWYTTTLGNNLVLNVIGLMVASYSISLAYLYFSMIAVGMFIYYSFNVYYKRDTLKEELTKYIIIILVLVIGGIYPASKGFF